MPKIRYPKKSKSMSIKKIKKKNTKYKTKLLNKIDKRKHKIDEANITDIQNKDNFYDINNNIINEIIKNINDNEKEISIEENEINEIINKNKAIIDNELTSNDIIDQNQNLNKIEEDQLKTNEYNLYERDILNKGKKII